MIILDLEWNRGYDKKPLNEILQIGAVRVERVGGPIVDTFNACLRPTVHKKFDLGAKKLPELGVFKTSHQRFPGAVEVFRTWCGGDKVFAGWGTGDVEALNENCKYWGLDSFEAEEFFDFQRAFAHALGADQQIALWRAAEYCGVPDVFDYHNALNDAMYTAVLGRWLTPEDLAWRPEPAPPKRRRAALKLSRLAFPRQARQRLGPVKTPEEVLDARTVRTLACPLCGRKQGIARWHFIPPGEGRTAQQYYGVFTCPEHGRFLCRLTLSRRGDGLWLGRRSVPEVTPELTREYAAALDGGVHVCKGKGRRRGRSARAGQEAGED